MREEMFVTPGKNSIIMCFVFLLVFISLTKIADYDFWWHLKLGEAVYNSGLIYSSDDFSYTFGGRHQFSAEWLADLIIYLSYRVWGLAGVNILKTFILLLTFMFLFMTLRNMSMDKDTGFYASVITLIVVLFSIRFRLFIRPYLFSFLFLSLFLFLIGSYERKRNIKILYLLPMMEIIWANMSKGAFYGPMLFLLFMAGDSFKNRVNPGLVVLFLSIIAFSMVNPETYRIYLLPTLYATDQVKEIVGEHQPLSTQILWGYGFKYTFAYQALVIGSLVCLVLLKGWKNIYHLLLFIAFFLQSVRLVRMIDLFSLVAALLFITPMEKFLKVLPSSILSRKALVNLIVSISIIALIPLSIAGSKTYSFGIGVKDDIFPEGAMAFLEKEGIRGRMFNSYPFGGYILWRSPERKVFIDGRGAGILYSNKFYNTYFDILKSAGAWKSAEQEWGFNYALFQYDITNRRHFAPHLNSNPDWALVYWDNHSAVYLKRTGENLKTIGTCEYRVTKPSFYDFSYLEVYLESKTAPYAIEQINREIALNPLNQEPRLAKVFLLYNLGSSYHDKALKELEFTLRLKPDVAMKHSAMAFLMLEKGLVKEAKEEVRKAIRIDPDDMGAKHLVKELGM